MKCLFLKILFFVFKDPDDSDLPKTWVYYIDSGRVALISRNHIYQLPVNFICAPAFDIACRLHSICPINGNEQSTRKLDDKVHHEVNRLPRSNKHVGKRLYFSRVRSYTIVYGVRNVLHGVWIIMLLVKCVKLKIKLVIMLKLILLVSNFSFWMKGEKKCIIICSMLTYVF
jgi:hypothetical protein